MAITFKSKTENIELTETYNDISILYRFTLKDNELIQEVQGDARIDSRIVYYINTRDGKNFNINSNQLATDDLTGLNEKMKADLISIYTNPTTYLPV